MKFEVVATESFQEQFNKLPEKYQNLIKNKVELIEQNPFRFKPLSNVMKGFRRVHIDKSFVLVYSIDEQTKTVILEDYDHHDRIY